MNKTDIILIYLSIQIMIFSYLLIKAEKRISYLEGRQSVQTEIDQAVNDIVGPYKGVKNYDK
jgi:hypothetical protein